MIHLFRKHRKYPVKRDEFGQSARKRAFNLFAQGYRPAQVSSHLSISTRTACRYFASYKKLWPYVPYSELRRQLKNIPALTTMLINGFSRDLNMSREDVMRLLSEPWGLMKLMKTHRQLRLNTIESRLAAALEIECFLELLSKKDPSYMRETLLKLMNMTASEKTGESSSANSSNDITWRRSSNG